MLRKVIIILIISSFILPVLADITTHKLPEPVTLKLLNQKKLKTYILCFTNTGFVTWNSNIYNPDQDFEKFAEYYSYNQLEYFKVAGHLSPLPAILGTTIGVITLGNADENEDLGAAAGAGFIMSLGVIVSFFSIFIPRTHTPHNKNSAERIPDRYYLYHDTVPKVIKEYIKKYEK